MACISDKDDGCEVDAAVKCNECGFLNPPNEEVCQACNSSLGESSASYQIDMHRHTGRYRQIRAKVEEVRAGHITAEQFAQWLLQLSHTLAEKATAIRENLEAMDYYRESPNECQIGLAGVQTFEAGLQELYEFTNDLDAMHLEQGLNLLWDGNHMIIEAMKINRASREALSQLWEQLQQES